jgi:hypothetical protein
MCQHRTYWRISFTFRPTGPKTHTTFLRTKFYRRPPFPKKSSMVREMRSSAAGIVVRACLIETIIESVICTGGSLAVLMGVTRSTNWAGIWSQDPFQTFQSRLETLHAFALTIVPWKFLSGLIRSPHVVGLAASHRIPAAGGASRAPPCCSASRCDARASAEAGEQSSRGRAYADGAAAAQ